MGLGRDRSDLTDDLAINQVEADGERIAVHGCVDLGYTGQSANIWRESAKD